MKLQIDVISNDNEVVICKLITDDETVKVIMTQNGYEALKQSGFFVRTGESPDSAGVLNTSKLYTAK